MGSTSLLLNRFDPKIIATICSSVNIRFRQAAQTGVTLNTHISDKQFIDLENEVMENGKA
jgi:hypothetical protein